MQDCFIIIWPEDNDAPLLWGRIRQSVVTETGEAALSEISAITGSQDPLCLIIPGQHVLSSDHTIPKMNRRERSNAVLFSLEDKIAAPLDSLHVALTEGDPQTVSVINREYIAEAQNWAEENGLTLHHMAADYDALSGLTPDPVNLSDRIVFPGRQGHTLDAEWYDGPLNSVDMTTLMTVIAENIPNTTNLLQGEFAPQSVLNRFAKPALQLGALAAALGLAVLFHRSMDARSMNAQADELRAQAATLYTQTTGQAAPSNLARTVLRQSRQGGQAPTEFLALNSLAFAALNEFDDVKIERLSYQNNRNEIQLRLIYPGFERAEAVQQAMKAAGGLFIPGGVREQNGRFVGEATLKLEGGGS